MRWTSSSIALALSAALLLASSASAQTPLAPGEIARVADRPILKTEYDQWYAIFARPRGDDGTLQGQVVAMMLTNRWLELEAARRGIVVAPGAVVTRFRRAKAREYPREADFERFLRTSGHTVATLKSAVRISLLDERLRAHVTRDAKTPAGQRRLLDRFLDRYDARWRARTVCGEEFASEYHCGTVVPLPA